MNLKAEVLELLTEAVKELDKFNTQDFVDPQEHRGAIQKVKLAKEKYRSLLAKGDI